MKKSNQAFFFMLSLIASVSLAHAEIYHIGSARTFDNEVADHKYAAVLFYDGRCAESLRRFKKASTIPFYQQAGLRFYAVDTSERRQLADLAADFDINPGNPSVMLYHRGVPVTNAKEQIVVLTHITCSRDIEAFIDTYLEDHLDNAVRKNRVQPTTNTRVVERIYYQQPEPKVHFGFGFGGPVVACRPVCPPCYYDCHPVSNVGFGFSIGL